MALFVAVPAALAMGPTSALAAGDGTGSVPVEPAHRSKALKPAHLSAHLHGTRHGKVKVGSGSAWWATCVRSCRASTFM